MHYDVIVIGGGPAGYTAAIAAAKENLKVALIEKKAVGGTCLNVGCIPTKALLHGAKVFTQVYNSESLGITCENVFFDEEKLYQKKDEIVSRLSTGIQTLLKQNGVSFYFDHASFTDEHHIQLKSSQEILEFDYAIISTGSKPIRLPLPGFDYDTVITSDELLQKPLNAEEIVIIGGGIIGCEFADYYQQIGKKVTIVEMQKRILGTLDKEIAQTISMSFKSGESRLLLMRK